MSRVKLTIEVDDSTYQSYKKKFTELKQKFPAAVMTYSTVEEYIASILDGMEKCGEKLESLGEKLNSKLSDILGSDFDFGNFEDMIKSVNKKEEKKEEPKPRLRKELLD